MRFYLGTHQPHWLRLTSVPLFVSHVTLASRRTLPRALGPWALDSGAFSEVANLGRFRTSPRQYVTAVRRYADDIGSLAWAAPQDWMCEPFILTRTGLTVAEHQRRTVNGLLELRTVAPDLPIIPVLQGWTLDDYHRCVDHYDHAGINLTTEPLVGLGSVCRRQGTDTITTIARSLARLGISLHGFGVKISGLGRYAYALASADSMAWSFDARRTRPFPDCPHRSCANCLRYALWWRAHVLARVTDNEQLVFPDQEAS